MRIRRWHLILLYYKKKKFYLVGMFFVCTNKMHAVPLAVHARDIEIKISIQHIIITFLCSNGTISQLNSNEIEFIAFNFERKIKE